MSIPASLAMSKLRYPEEEESITANEVIISDASEKDAENTIHAFARGAWLGLRVAGMVAASLLCIIALLALVNALLSWWGTYWGFTNLTLELILGYAFYPVGKFWNEVIGESRVLLTCLAFLLGVSRDDDLLKVGQLLGIKVIA